MPGSSADAAVTAPTQQAIGAILKHDSTKTPEELVRDLMQLEASQMLLSCGASQDSDSQEQSARREYACCCFDATHRAWTSHVICERCCLLNELLKRESR